jgi:hypothetical protein
MISAVIVSPASAQNSRLSPFGSGPETTTRLPTLTITRTEVPQRELLRHAVKQPDSVTVKELLDPPDASLLVSPVGHSPIQVVRTGLVQHCAEAWFAANAEAITMASIEKIFFMMCGFLDVRNT